VSEKWDNPRQNNDVATGCLRFVVAPVIMLWILFLAYTAIAAGSVSATIPLASGATGLLVLSCVGVWKLAQRSPKMRPALAFAAGALLVLAASAKVILVCDSAPVAIVVLIVALAAIVLLVRWTLRRMLTMNDPATTPAPPPRDEPR
jgi:hypothetical protein